MAHQMHASPLQVFIVIALGATLPRPKNNTFQKF